MAVFDRRSLRFVKGDELLDLEDAPLSLVQQPCLRVSDEPAEELVVRLSLRSKALEPVSRGGSAPQGLPSIPTTPLSRSGNHSTCHARMRSRTAGPGYSHQPPSRAPCTGAIARFGTVEEIAHTALFLAAPESGFITGITLSVDGGAVAAGAYMVEKYRRRKAGFAAPPPTEG